jgi:hypothetical protein
MTVRSDSSNHLDHRMRAASLRDFLHDCIASTVAEEADRLREAARLLNGAKLDHGGNEPEAVEAMLAVGAGVSAALAIIGDQAGFMLSRGGNGLCLAMFVLADGTEDMVAEGATPALALLAAHVSALLCDLEQWGATAPARNVATAARLH